MASCLLWIDLECFVQGAAGGQHTNFTIKYNKRLGNRVDDCLSKLLRVFDILQVDHGRKLIQSRPRRSCDSHV